MTWNTVYVSWTVHNFLIFTRLVLLDCGWPVVICAEKLFANVVHLFNNEFTLKYGFFSIWTHSTQCWMQNWKDSRWTHKLATVCFHPPIFMCILEYRIKQSLNGNAKMRINSKNAHKKRMRTFEWDKLLSDKKKCAQTMTETHLPNKFLHAHRKSHILFFDIDRITWLAVDRSRSQHLYVVMVILKSLSKVCPQSISCLTLMRSQTAASTSESNVFRLLALRHK